MDGHLSAVGTDRQDGHTIGARCRWKRECGSARPEVPQLDPSHVMTECQPPAVGTEPVEARAGANAGNDKQLTIVGHLVDVDGPAGAVYVGVMCEIGVKGMGYVLVPLANNSRIDQRHARRRFVPQVEAGPN